MGHVSYSKLTPGKMPDLVESLSNSSFWMPLQCHTDSLYTSHFKARTKGKIKNRRPSGWKTRTLHYGEYIMDGAVSSIFKNFSNHFYPFESRQLCEENLDLREKGVGKIGLGKGIVYSELLKVSSMKKCEDYPNLPSGSWGTCAFVSSGSNLLRGKRGKQIDSFDTVIRLGHMPLSGWEEYVGGRTDVLIGRGSIQSKHNQKYTTLKYIIGKDVNKPISGVQYLRVADSLNYYPETVILGEVKLKLGSPRFARTLYRVMTDPIGKKYRGPSTGYAHVLRILFSSLCSKLHVFGLSSECGGHYYDQKALMKKHHSCELESWTLHYLMKKHHNSTNLCIWNF